MIIDWSKAPKWAVDVRDANGAYGIGLIFTNDDKRYADIKNEDDNFERGQKDYLGVIVNSKIIEVMPYPENELNVEVDVEALKLCCRTYESSSIKQQELMTEKDKKIRHQALRIEKLEKIIVNNIKNGKQFIDVPRGT